MAFLDHEGGAEFPYRRDDVFDALVEAIPTVSGLKVHTADKLAGRVLAKAEMSLIEPPRFFRRLVYVTPTTLAGVSWLR